MRDAAAGDPWGDAPVAELAAVDLVVVAAIGQQLPRATTGPADQSADRRDGVDQGQQLGDVVAVAAGDADRQRQAAGVADQVVLAASSGTIDRRGPVWAPL